MSNILDDDNVLLTIDTLDNFKRVPNVITDQSSALQSQYAHSPQFVGMAKLAHDLLSLDNFQDFLIEHYFDVETADGVGLDSIAARVGVKREADMSDGTRYILNDSELRALIEFKARANIGEGNIPSILNGLDLLFGKNTLSILDNGNMTTTIVINLPISRVQLWILKNYGLAQRPAGVGYRIVNNADESLFGFKGQDLSTFNYGVFNYEITGVNA